MEFETLFGLITEISVVFFEPFGVQIYASQEPYHVFNPNELTPTAIIAKTFNPETEFIDYPMLYCFGANIDLFNFIFSIVSDQRYLNETVASIQSDLVFYQTQELLITP